jgi:hypothetical protein
MRTADRVEKEEGAALDHEAPRAVALVERAKLLVLRVLRVLVERERVVVECAVARTTALESRDENAFVQTIAGKGASAGVLFLYRRRRE